MKVIIYEKREREREREVLARECMQMRDCKTEDTEIRNNRGESVTIPVSDNQRLQYRLTAEDLTQSSLLDLDIPLLPRYADLGLYSLVPYTEPSARRAVDSALTYVLPFLTYSFYLSAYIFI